MNERTLKVFQSLRKHGLKLNKNKCRFHQSELLFLGHKITSIGISPDENKIKAIVDMPYLQNVKELQRFLGTVNYLAKFILNHSDRTASLRKLLEKKKEWYLDDQLKLDIQCLKKVVTEAPVLRFFDLKKPTKISCDASMNDLGAVLEQKHGDVCFPVAYASRSLTTSEVNYCQLEKETLSIVFACAKFHDYVYGIKFHIYNDHLPLKSIFKKSLIKSPPRIQRFMLRLQKYDFEMHYIQGNLLTVADTLSRASLKDANPEIPEEEIRLNVHSFISNCLISESRLKQFKVETENDDTLRTLRLFVENGWPAHRKDLPIHVRPYYNYRQELTVIDGVILKGERIVVPSNLRKEMKQLLHSGHLGMVKTKGRACDTLFWPGITSDLEHLISSCEACLEFQNKQQRESVKPHDIPWTKVGTDLFDLHSKSYLIIVDYTTNFYDISQIPDKTSRTLVTHSKRIFSKFGMPKIVFSDNGAEFTGSDYVRFSKEWDFHQPPLP